jgi:hypothetical protein
MPVIERKILGNGQAAQSDAPVTWDGDEVLGKANALTYIDIALPASTVLASVQRRVLNISTPAIPQYALSNITPNLPTTGGPPTIMPGIYFLSITTWITSAWQLIALSSARSKYGDSYVQDRLGGIDINMRVVGASARNGANSTGLVQYSDGSYHIVLTVMRPFFKTRVPTFLNVTTIWYPFSLDVQMTGFALEGISATGIPDEEVSVRVIDENCQTFYGVRPGKEEQSDFIENQTQALRVGEQLLWQSQMVIDASALVTLTPAIRRGSTVRILYPLKNLDILGLVKNVTHRFSIDAQGMGQIIASTQCEIKATEFIFRTAGGEEQDAEKLDKRQ